MNLLSFQLITPEKTVLSQQLKSLTVPTMLGQITVLPNHVPLVAALAPGEIHARTESDEFFLYVSGGFIEIRQNNEVILLADTAEHHYEIDAKQAEEAMRRAEAALHEERQSAEEYAKVAASLEQSLARFNVARKHAHRKTPITSEGVLTE